jgi:small subunit ribosomal protein S17
MADNDKTPSRRQVKVGTVVSDRMDKTVVVRVERIFTHPLYHRQLKRSSKFAAHDEADECKVGDRVEITASRPLSRTKRWRVTGILQKAAVVD